jgi:hypothetical protein
MPAWSYIPYTFAYAKEPSACFHPLFADAAYKRICHTLAAEFPDISDEKLYFLQRMMDGILKNKHGQQAHMIVLESFGKPLFILRNLAHTLQDPADRTVYVIHLEDALHIWRIAQKERTTNWEAVAFVGIVGLVGVALSWFNGTLCTPNIRPHALMSFYSAAH